MKRSVHALLKMGLTLCWAGFVALGATGCGDGGNDGAAEGGPAVDDTAVVGAMPVFLLAGQSNMVGNVNETLFETLLGELTKGSSSDLQTRLTNDLHDWYFNTDGGYASYGYSAAIAKLETSAFIQFQRAGLANANLRSPHSQVLCSINENPIAPLTTNCGSSFGPELMMGHVLSTTKFAPTSLIKVAVGGTTLYTDWRSPASGGTTGPLYLNLRSRIQSLKTKPASVHPKCATQACRWGAFIWFQGENDSNDAAHANAYKTELTRLIADVRKDVNDPALPVIIVQLNAWAQTLAFGPTVAAAQQQVVSQDTHAALVKTNDLSGFYHLDPIAQLVIGQRVAQAVQRLVTR
jgi:Carbohydrate esterase, sialic acid-specific acetylesterase